MPALMASMFCDMFRRAMARITAVWFSLTLIVIFPSRIIGGLEKIKALRAMKPKAPIVFDLATINLA